MKNNRPLGIIIIGFLLIITGLFSFYPLLTVAPSVVETLPKRVIIYWVISGSIFIVTGVGLLRLKKWSRILAIILVCIKTVYAFAGSARDTLTMTTLSAGPIPIYFGIGLTVLSAIIGCWAIYYLFTPSVKELLNY